MFSRNVKGILERQWSRKKICHEVKTEEGSTYQCDRVSTCGGCETNVSAVRGRWWPDSHQPISNLIYTNTPL